MKVGFQGEHGAYSEMAVKKAFPKAEAVPCASFYDAFGALENGEVEALLMPVENSTEGSVTPVYDLLAKTKFNAFKEVFLRIEHCLITNPKNRIEDIKDVYSHPQALGQCREFLKKSKYREIAYYDTAGAVKMIMESGRKDAAAIASEAAAGYYGMKIIEKNIEDNPNNITRFLALGKDMKTEFKKENRYKTSIIFSIKHEPGTLFRIVKAFAERNINMTKIESRPTKKTAWEYLFFVDFEGHCEDKNIVEALEEIEKNSFFVNVVGSYPWGE